MTKKQIKKLDAIKDGDECSAAIVHNGLTLARIDKGLFLQRQPAPIGFAWTVFAKTRSKADIYILPTHKVTIFPNNHVRIDI